MVPIPAVFHRTLIDEETRNAYIAPRFLGAFLYLKLKLLEYGKGENE
jgi:hypothetical protein